MWEILAGTEMASLKLDFAPSEMHGEASSHRHHEFLLKNALLPVRDRGYARKKNRPLFALPCHFFTPRRGA